MLHNIQFEYEPVCHMYNTMQIRIKIYTVKREKRNTVLSEFTSQTESMLGLVQDNICRAQDDKAFSPFTFSNKETKDRMQDDDRKVPRGSVYNLSRTSIQ